MNDKVKFNREKDILKCEHGEIVENGDSYWPCWGVSFIYITDNEIEKIKNGAMFYYDDGEYAYCLMYKEKE
jgi:hypothetical protein